MARPPSAATSGDGRALPSADGSMDAATEPRESNRAGPWFRFTLIELLVVLAISQLFSFRLVSLPMFLCAACVSSRCEFRIVRLVCWCLFCASLIQPYDVRIANLSRSHRGVSESRIALVPYVAGMPAHTALIEQHGQYYTGGCSSGSAFPPRTIVSLDLGTRNGVP